METASERILDLLASGRIAPEVARKLRFRRKDGGYAWVDLVANTAPSQKPFEAVKAEVRAEIMDKERRKALADLGLLSDIRTVVGVWHVGATPVDDRERVMADLRALLTPTHEVRFRPYRGGAAGYFTAHLRQPAATVDGVRALPVKVPEALAAALAG